MMRPDLLDFLGSTHAFMRFAAVLRKLCCVSIAVGCNLACEQAHADLPLITVGEGRTRDSTNIYGYAFEVTHDLTVTGLAKMDGNANGILDDVIAPHGRFPNRKIRNRCRR